MTTPSAPLRILLVAAPGDAEGVRACLEAARPCRVTVVPRLADAAGGAAWHDVVVMAGTAAADARHLPSDEGTSPHRLPPQPPLLALLDVPPDIPGALAGIDSDAADATVIRDERGDWRIALPALVSHLARRGGRARAESDAHAELARQRSLFDGFMRHSPAVAYLKDADGRYTWVNAAFESFFGLADDEWRGRSDAEIWGEDAGARLRENDLAVLEGGEALEVEDVVPMEDGPHHWLAYKFPWRDEQGRPQVGGMAVDVTPIRRAEEERRQVAARLAQAHRLESLGSLASNIAHDFNNMLVSVMGNAGLAMLDVPEDSPAALFLEQVERSALRAADLTHHLLAVTGRASLLADSISLGDFIESRAFMLRTRLPRASRLLLDVEPGVPDVLADCAQLEQVLGTLVERAGRGTSPTVTIRVRSRPMQAEELCGLLLGECLAPGTHVIVDVEDDGPAVNEADIAALLEPEFEPAEDGAPSGMAAVLGLVRGHGGAVGAEPLPDRGLRIRLALPTAHPAAADEELPPPSTHGGTILVVDDEEQVRSVARAALQRFGWTVLVARDGEEALGIFSEMGDQVSVVLLDTTMPGLSGVEVLGRMKAMHPAAKVVLTSGFPRDEVLSSPEARLAEGFLAKPYRPARLLTIIRALAESDGIG